MAKAPKKSTLPKPYVSKALRAVLMPVTKEVARKFRLARGAKGVMVVSVKPDGLGKLAGLKPGDVISTILGRQVKKPSDVDTIIAYFLAGGTSDYQIGGTRKGGRTFRAATYITPAYFYQPFDVYSAYTWTSFSYQTYSYSEYVSYYSRDITTSYQRSETYISETISSSTFVQEMTTETNYEYSSYDEQIVDGSYTEGGSGSVWQGNESEVVYDPTDDPVALEVPDVGDPGDSDQFTASEGDPDYVDPDPGDVADPNLYADDASAAAPDDTSQDPSTDGTAAASDTTTNDQSSDGATADGTDDQSADPSVDAGSDQSADPAVDGGSDQSADPAVDEGSDQSADPAVDEGSDQSADPAVDAGSDQSADQPVDDGSAEQQCAGQTVDGCGDSSGGDTGGDAGSYDTGGGDAGSYDSGGGDTGGDAGSYDTGGGDSGGDAGSYDSGGDTGGGDEPLAE
ncbi:MAG: hypothetical protein ABIV25_14200 [Paracoccaceae bacterium]